MNAQQPDLRLRHKPAPSRALLRRHSWCGPFALAVIAGITYDDAYARTLRRLNYKRRHKRRCIQGMHNHEIEIAVKSLLKVKRAFVPLKSTVRRLRETLKPNRLFIIASCDHFIVVDSGDWSFCDNTSTGWRQLAEAKNQNVQHVMEVRPSFSASAA